jgi:beta-N-acetylhexosaminidase
MEDQLGQLLMIEMPKAVWRPSLERLLQRFRPGGLLFREITSAGAVAETAHEAARLLGATPFLAIEEEGGGSLSALFAPLPATEWLDLDDVERAGDLIGSAMALVGLNLDLAPAADLPEASKTNAAASARSGQKSSSPGSIPLPVEIAHRGEAFLRGLARHQILACARHFPGLPASLRKPGPGLPEIARSMAELWREDLVPYRALRDEVPLIQISHAAYKAYDYEFPRPASLSPVVVEGLLRVKLGYGGVALADISSTALAARIEASEASVQALAAGCDLILVSGEEPVLDTVKNSLARALESGRLRRERVEQALARVKRAKKALIAAREQPSERDLARVQRDFETFGSR